MVCIEEEALGRWRETACLHGRSGGKTPRGGDGEREEQGASKGERRTSTGMRHMHMLISFFFMCVQLYPFRTQRSTGELVLHNN